MELILTGLVLVGLIASANLIETRRQSQGQHWFHWILLVLHLPILVAGLLLVGWPQGNILQGAQSLNPPAIDLANFGWVVTALGLWGLLFSLHPVRKLISRFTNINPSSTVHALALIMAGYLVGETALALSQGGLEGLAETLEPQSISTIVFTELLFAGIGLLGVGALIRRRGPSLTHRLGLKRPTALHFVTALGWIGFMVVVQAIGSMVWALLNPDQAEALGDVNTLLIGEIDTVGEWLILAAATGIGEEILFRGALQPVLGLFATSTLFAIVHFQYGFTPFLLIVVFLALVFGYLRRRYSTTYAIIVHAGYNFTLGMLALLATRFAEFTP